jgi:HSP20 family protein
MHREMNRLFDGVHRRSRVDFPALNVWRGNNGSLVTAEMPGVAPEDLDISVRGNTLVLRGHREPDELGDGEFHHRRERGYGQFVRSLQLPHQVDAEQVEATCRKGVLRVELPMTKAHKPKQIPIKAG